MLSGCNTMLRHKALCITVSAVLAGGCAMTSSGDNGDFTKPSDARSETAAADPFTPSGTAMSGSRVAAAIERARAGILAVPGVYGVSEGRTPLGDPAIRVDVEDDAVAAHLPATVEGFSVVAVVVRGGFEIQGGN
jgi:hypothetical protein